MCVDSKGDSNKPIDVWQCHQQGGNQVKKNKKYARPPPPQMRGCACWG